MIVATAGHIDHGKTTLVRALTGTDTDRLPEEKRRGISIDLGFAYWKTRERVIGFVDVPGHERFVHNMLAGVCAIDGVLLVVAADDGPMPQTVEHLNIVDLLAVTHGLAVVTKIDRVDAGRVEQVTAALRELLAPTGLAGIEILPVSATTGEGLPLLRERLGAAARDWGGRGGARRLARYAVDRAFTIAGSGTVVTGTVLDGDVATGDHLVLAPSGQEVRVRALQQRGEAVEKVAAGERCAINLAGTAVADVPRGTLVLHPALLAPSRRIDVRLSVLASQARPLRHWTPVHLHLGTSDVLARVGIRRGEAVAPGETRTVQLVLDAPVSAANGDRFILRDQSAQATTGGGVVLDPLAPRRAPKQRAEQLAALATLNAAQALAGLATSLRGGIDLTWLAVVFGLAAEDAAEAARRAGLVLLGEPPGFAMPRAAVDATLGRIADLLRQHHADAPREAGLSPARLRALAAPALAAPLFALLLRQQVQKGTLRLAHGTAALVSHVTTENLGDQRLWQALRPLLEAAGLPGLSIAELASMARVKEAMLGDFLHRKARTGDVVRITPERFYLRTTLIAFTRVLEAAAEAAEGGQFTAAQVRDRSGIGRGLAIQLLERLDRLGITRRHGDRRVLEPDPVVRLGAIGFERTPTPSESEHGQVHP